MSRKKIGLILVSILVILIVSTYFNYYVKNEEKETEKKPLYFILSIEKSDNIPYRFKSNNTVFVIEKDKIICYGGIEAVGNDINVSLPKDYEWGENDYFAITLKYDPKFIERYFSEPKEQRGQGYYQNLRFILEKSYIMSDSTDSKNYPYYLDADKTANNNQILLKPLVSYFKEKHPEHRVFSIKYYLRFSLEYFDDEFQKWVSLAPISDGDHIYLWTQINVHLRGIEVSKDLLIEDIQPESPERFSRYVLYRTRYGEKEYINFHIVIGEPSSPWEELNLRAQSNLGIIVLILGPVSIFLTALSLWINLKNRNDKNPIMKHENMSIKKISVGISISAIFLIFIRLIWPNVNIDWITIALIVIAIIPWIAPLLKSLEIPGGWKIEFRHVKDASEKVTSGKKFEIAKKRDFITLEPIIKHDPSLALVYLRIEIEKRVRKLAEKYNVGTECDSPRRLLRTLHYHKVLPANVFSGLEELVILGNKAAHGTKVSLDAAEWALDSGPRILRVLDDILNKKENGKQEGKQK